MMDQGDEFPPMEFDPNLSIGWDPRRASGRGEGAFDNVLLGEPQVLDQLDPGFAAAGTSLFSQAVPFFQPPHPPWMQPSPGLVTSTFNGDGNSNYQPAERYDAHCNSQIPAEFQNSLLLTDTVHYTVPGGFSLVPMRDQIPKSQFAASNFEGSLAPQMGLMQNNSSPCLDRQSNQKKPRYACQRPGCRSSFSRSYDLQRHEDTIHQRSLTLYCFVYGCNRTMEPFPREDKFAEHWRKHHRHPDKFVCPSLDCHAGPFDLAELVVHLTTVHTAELLSGSLFSYMKKAKLRAVQIAESSATRPGIIRLDHINACPLAFLGCTFHDSPSFPVEDHLKEHSLLDRSRGFDLIMCSSEYHQYQQWNEGRASCPICRQEICDKSGNIRKFLRHIINDHSREDRIGYKLELMDLFRPFIDRPSLLRCYFGLEWDLPQKVLTELFSASVEPQGRISNMNTGNNTGID